ncbi:MAG: hypothetical protein EZS28_052249 [Streblomastix strix]|uniref:Uncharacterized protein n=1 Tax=Streblomastix strix TaxID=222440 RepID=A0A5J4SG19_9EUKA|nr:MAG: hypothetical protein EZS28_052249 [Streblomastix strix]
MISWQQWCEDLSKPIGVVCGQDGQIDSQRQIEICKYMIGMFKDSKKNDELRKLCILSGAAKALLNIFQNLKLKDIKLEHSEAFSKLTFTDNNEILQLLFNLDSFKCLLNLLNHSNSDIQLYGIQSIFNIQFGGSKQTSITEVHPYFDAIASVGGIDKIFEFMNRNNTTKNCKDLSAITIGYFYRARKIENVWMRIRIISYLKSIIYDKNNQLNGNEIWALKYLSQNLVNNAEIVIGGFMIPS